MPKCQDLPTMSSVASQKRTAKACAILGKAGTKRLIALALYLLGANLKGLANFVDMPLDTIKALAKRTFLDGLSALEDRRYKASTFLSRDETPRPLSCRLQIEKDSFVVEIDGANRIRLLRRNAVQCRTFLLTLLDAKLLDIGEVARALGLSYERTRKLRKELVEGGVNAIIDKRRGQQKDYLFTPEVKSELVQQFAFNVVTGQPTSGRAIAEDLYQRCEIVVSGRSVRQYLRELGLSRIGSSLLELIETQKKTSSDS